jgi:hypothetical protein
MVANAENLELLKESLIEFYKEPGHLEKVLPIIRPGRGSQLSGRLLDFFVVNFVKDRPVEYEVAGQLVNVQKSFRAHQRRFKKRFFDVFARGGREEWTINGLSFKSNIRQLCFMRWALENKVVDYVQQNYAQISEAMNKDAVLRRSLPRRKRRSRCDIAEQEYIATRTKSRIRVLLKFH